MKAFAVLLLTILGIHTANAADATESAAGFWRKDAQLAPILVRAEDEVPQCGVLNRTQGRRIERMGSAIQKVDEIEFVLELGADESASRCLSADLRTICDQMPDSDRVVVRFITVAPHTFYRPNGRYEMNGLCENTGLSRVIHGPSGLQFVSTRQFKAIDDWRGLSTESR